MLRGEILFKILLATGVIAALLTIVQMWFEFVPWDIFIKSMVTLLIVGTLASFLMAVNYDMPGSRAKILMGCLVVLACFGAGLTTAQIWWEITGWSIFAKLIITDVILIGLCSFILTVNEDFGSQKRLKDKNFID